MKTKSPALQAFRDKTWRLMEGLLKRNESFFERALDKLKQPLYTPSHTSGAAETQGRTDG
ncbi:hypothetical protein [Rhizobium sp. SGZ-381]|uniref:hypothetical protein n=1 Tax=Rhizobium sp. SGZ-381 TaxID=3342800 RepID=UPI00367291D0